MTTTALHQPTRRRRRPLLIAGAALVASSLVVPVLGAGSAGAASTPQSDAAATWLAGLVGPDGAVENPSSGTASVSATLQVALSLIANQSDRDAIDRAVAYVEANAEAYIVVSGVDNPGRLGYLLMLASATGADPTSYGTTGIDLLARLDALYGSSEPGLWGLPDEYSAAFNQSLAVLGLVAVGQPVPAGGIGWLLDQQCGTGNNSEGGWQPYRATVSGALVDCDESSGSFYTGADSNTTAIAVQAVAAAGFDSPIPGALQFLALTQSGADPAGGFGFYAGSTPDPNSTALGIQALVAAGESPTGAAWTVGGGNPFSSLASWQLSSGADTGALTSPYSEGAADFGATLQGVWGLTMETLPFAPLPAPTPTTTTTAPAPSTTSTTTTTSGGGAAPVVVAPRFTG